jgi:hypothetical protein
MGRMTKRLAIGVVGALLLPLSACGDPEADYCKDLEKDRKAIAEMVGSDSPAAALLGGLPMLRDLSEKSPDDLTDEWQIFIGALEGLDKALDDAGVKPADFDGGRRPAGLSVAEQKAIADAAGQISTDEVVAASSGIEQQARDVCKVNLGL